MVALDIAMGFAAYRPCRYSDSVTMTFVVYEREYELLRASSAEGMAFELWLVGAPAGPIAQVSYRDSDGVMTFSAFDQEVPFELIEKLVSNAREALTPAAKVRGET
jgi:hypothetical protein